MDYKKYIFYVPPPLYCPYENNIDPTSMLAAHRQYFFNKHGKDWYYHCEQADNYFHRKMDNWGIKTDTDVEKYVEFLDLMLEIYPYHPEYLSFKGCVYLTMPFCEDFLGPFKYGRDGIDIIKISIEIFTYLVKTYPQCKEYHKLLNEAYDNFDTLLNGVYPKDLEYLRDKWEKRDSNSILEEDKFKPKD